MNERIAIALLAIWLACSGLMLGCKPREHFLFVEGYNGKLGNTGAFVYWIWRKPKNKKYEHSLFRKWEVIIGTAARKSGPVLHVGDTIHMPDGVWKLRMCFPGIKRNKALMVKLREKATK